MDLDQIKIRPSLLKEASSEPVDEIGIHKIMDHWYLIHVSLVLKIFNTVLHRLGN